MAADVNEPVQQNPHAELEIVCWGVCFDTLSSIKGKIQ